MDAISLGDRKFKPDVIFGDHGACPGGGAVGLDAAARWAVPWGLRTGLFDDGPLLAYLVDRETMRSEPHFFVHEGRACCAVYLETRLRQGTAEATPAGKINGPPINVDEYDRSMSAILSPTTIVCYSTE